MIAHSSNLDKTAIGLSFLCVIHCLALPFILALIPSLTALKLDNEAFHFWMIIIVIPTSLYALTLGCKQHKRHNILAIGGTGLIFLLMAIAVPESILGETGETLFTLIGASLIAFGHFRNFKLCKKSEQCGC